jgi:hypothetical protein
MKKRTVLILVVAILAAHSSADAQGVLLLKQEREGGPAINLSGKEMAELGDPFFNLVLRNHADVVSLPEIENLIQPDRSKRDLFVVHERIVDSSRSSPRRSVTSYRSKHNGEILDSNVMLSVFFSSEGFPESPSDSGAMHLQRLEAWGWDNHRGRYNYYLLDQSGTPDLRMSWKFRGSSVGADLLTSFDRQNTCMACHINGAPIMKELFLPWNNWHSFKALAAYLQSTSMPAVRWPVATSEKLQELKSAERLEIAVVPAIRQFNTRRINATLKREDATGNVETDAQGLQTVVEARRLLRYLFETTEFNIISATVKSGVHPLAADTVGLGSNIQIPNSFFLNANLIAGGGPGGYAGLELSSTRNFSADARAIFTPAEYAAAVERATLRLFGQPGDANFAWLVPEPSHVDNDLVDQLMTLGIVPGQFVAAVQAIDLRNPVLSADRASLLEFMPERIRFRPIDPQERMDVDLFTNHELTKAVIAAIEAAAPAAGTSAAEFLDLLRMGSGQSPQEVLAARIVAYRTEVRGSLSSGVPDGRTTAIDSLLAKAIAVRKLIAEHEVLGQLDETGGFGLFPSP